MVIVANKYVLLTWFPGIMPPQNPTSVQHWPDDASFLQIKFLRVVVGGIEFSGISITVVTPPEIAASVPVLNPSQLVLPGSFK